MKYYWPSLIKIKFKIDVATDLAHAWRTNFIKIKIKNIDFFICMDYCVIDETEICDVLMYAKATRMYNCRWTD